MKNLAEALARLAVLCGLYVILVALGICVHIFGWGLEPQSWGWILGGALGTLFITFLIHMMSVDD